MTLATKGGGDLGKAAVDQAHADYENKQAQRERRLKLTDLAASKEEQQTYASAADMARAGVEQQKANLERARINLERTEMRAPVSGWVTNLLIRQGDYATTGQMAMSIVAADSFWVDGYFEETALPRIQAGDPAKIWRLAMVECCRDGSIALRAASWFPMRLRARAGSCRSTQSLRGFGSRNASPCGSRSVHCRRT